jgi:hypothetical protein
MCIQAPQPTGQECQAKECITSHCEEFAYISCVCVITNQIYITLNNDFDKHNYFLQWVHSVMNCIDNLFIIRSRFKTQ